MAESDSLYSKIVREMFAPAWTRTSGKQTISFLAKKLGVDEETVRNTLAKMNKSGFLKSWSLTPNPHLFGMEWETLSVNAASSSREKAVTQLRLVDGIVAIYTFLNDPMLRIVLCYVDSEDLERKIRLISSISGSTRPQASWKVLFPPHNIKLKRTDWLIIRLLLRNSKRSVSEIAKGTGISTRTVTRRLSVMIERRSFFLRPIVDVKRLDGFLYQFVISFHDAAKKSIADGIMRGSVRNIIYADTYPEGYSIIAAICQNLSEAEQVTAWLRSMDGVKEVTPTVVEDIIFVQDWISHEIEKRLR